MKHLLRLASGDLSLVEDPSLSLRMTNVCFFVMLNEMKHLLSLASGNLSLLEDPSLALQDDRPFFSF